MMQIDTLYASVCDVFTCFIETFVRVYFVLCVFSSDGTILVLQQNYIFKYCVCLISTNVINLSFGKKCLILCNLF